MKLLKSLFAFSFFYWFAALQSEVHVMYTSALISNDYDKRKEEYLASIEAMRSYGYEPWIIEATNINSSFYDQLTDQIFYPQKNDSSLRNKGVNETMCMRGTLEHLPFQDEDIVVKLTGRYLLYKRDFLTLIENSESEYDAYVSYGKHFVGSDHIFTGCFAMRWKYFRKIIEELDVERAEREYISVEQLFAEFIRDNNLRVKVVDPLNVIARVACEGIGILDF